MKCSIGIWLAVVAVVTSSLSFAAEKEVHKHAVQLMVELTDGSRVIGITRLSSLPVRSEALGKIEVPLAKIRTIKFSKDRESVAITLANGDSIKGGLGELTLKLQTIFGDVTVPVEHITTINVSAADGNRGHFSAVADFSGENNPNGAWSYGWRAKDGEEFRLFTRQTVQESYPGMQGWRGEHDTPAMAVNNGKEVLHPHNSMTIQPGQLCFHPGGGGEQSVIRWTATVSGRYRVSGTFTGLSGYSGQPRTSTDVHVWQNAKRVFSSFLNVQGHGNEAPFDLVSDVNAGDTVDFVVGFGNGSHGWDTTGLEAIITLKGNQP